MRCVISNHLGQQRRQRERRAREEHLRHRLRARARAPRGGRGRAATARMQIWREGPPHGSSCGGTIPRRERGGGSV